VFEVGVLSFTLGFFVTGWVDVLSFTLGLFTTGLVSPGTVLTGFLIGSTHFLSSEILVKSKKTFF
jgi:hypothetical protein